LMILWPCVWPLVTKLKLEFKKPQNSSEFWGFLM
jgi:hypothetical protein